MDTLKGILYKGILPAGAYHDPPLSRGSDVVFGVWVVSFSSSPRSIPAKQPVLASPSPGNQPVMAFAWPRVIQPQSACMSSREPFGRPSGSSLGPTSPAAQAPAASISLALARCLLPILCVAEDPDRRSPSVANLQMKNSPPRL